MKNHLIDKSSAKLVKGVAGGIAAGVFASFVMNQFQNAWTAIKDGEKSGGDKPEPATVKVADRACLAVSGKPIPTAYRPLAGNAVHYGLGAGLGAAYAGVAHFAPAVTMAGGSAYSAAVWLGLDEGVLPSMGLGEKWAKVPIGTHIYGLISHLVFGAALEGAHRLFRRAPA